MFGTTSFVSASRRSVFASASPGCVAGSKAVPRRATDRRRSPTTCPAAETPLSVRPQRVGARVAAAHEARLLQRLEELPLHGVDVDLGLLLGREAR